MNYFYGLKKNILVSLFKFKLINFINAMYWSVNIPNFAFISYSYYFW